MIIVPPAVQTALAAMSAQELRDLVNENKRDLAYALWEAKRRGYTVVVVHETPNNALNDNEAREIVVSAAKQVQL